MSATESSIHTSRIFATTISNRVVYADTSKNEVTWYATLSDYDHTYDATQRVFKGWWYRWRDVHMDSDGNPNVFNVKRNDDGKLWLNTNWTNPDDQWNLDNRIVFRLRNSLHFSPAPTGEFCFITCPCQPPSILPTSSTFSEMAVYGFVSKLFISHSN